MFLDVSWMWNPFLVVRYSPHDSWKKPFEQKIYTQPRNPRSTISQEIETFPVSMCVCVWERGSQSNHACISRRKECICCKSVLLFVNSSTIFSVILCVTTRPQTFLLYFFFLIFIFGRQQICLTPKKNVCHRTRIRSSFHFMTQLFLTWLK